MSFQLINGSLNLQFGAFGTVILAVLTLLLGNAVKKHSGFCRKYCIPSPVIGGVLFALLHLLFYLTGMLELNLDTAYQNDMQYMFFTIVGFGASFSLLKKGGKKLILYFILTGILILLEACIGILGAKITGISAIYGIICGPAPLAGGHGSVAAYGEMLEGAGYQGAMVTGMAAATFGLIAGSFFGGPLCSRLIRRNKLKTPSTAVQTKASVSLSENASGDASSANTEITMHSVFTHLALIGSFIVLGGILGNHLSIGLGTLTGGKISLPGFCGPMLVAFVVRNVNEKFHFLVPNDKILHIMEELSLGIFLSMAMISLKLWELVELAVPMVIILILELTAVLAFIYLLVFRLLGRDYEAAACCAGLCGHSFGATPNGIANLKSVSEQFGYPAMAFLIVPIVGGFLQDIFLVPVNVFLINLFG